MTPNSLNVVIVSVSAQLKPISASSLSLCCLANVFKPSRLPQLLQTPAHVLPSTSFLCWTFAQSLLISVAGDKDRSVRVVIYKKKKKRKKGGVVRR